MIYSSVIGSVYAFNKIMKNKRYIFHSPAETQAFAADLAARIDAGAVIALIGDLGTGKTTFTQGFARGLGITDAVGSPTYKIVSEYLGDRLSLYHVDCYRLTNSVDFLNIGGEALLNPGSGVTLIEWADFIADLWPENTIRIDFKRITDAEDSRELCIVG